MGYDYRNGSSSPVGSVAPLGGPGYDIGDTIRAYVGRIPASKVILGVPYYGRAWSTSTSSSRLAEHLGHQVRGLDDRRLHDRPRLRRRPRQADGIPSRRVAWTVYRRENCTTTYGCVKPWRQLYYDDAKALGLKYDVVNRYNLRGAGIWALGYDGTRTELYSVLKAKFITDTVPPVISAASLSTPFLSPNGDGRMDTATVRLAVTGHLRFGWDVKPFFDGIAGAAVRQGERRRQERGLHLGWQERVRHGGPGRTVSDHRLDRGRLEQQGIDQQGRDRRPACGGSHPRRVAGLGLAQRRRPLGPHEAVLEGRPSVIAGKARLLRQERHDRPSLDDRCEHRRIMALERPEHGRDDGRRRPLHVPRPRVSTGPATRPSAT